MRFSACPIYDRNRQSTEDGIAPDHVVSITDSDLQRGIDTIIEEARKKLNDSK